jgi:hypothetical protein
MWSNSRLLKESEAGVCVIVAWENRFIKLRYKQFLKYSKQRKGFPDRVKDHAPKQAPPKRTTMRQSRPKMSRRVDELKAIHGIKIAWLMFQNVAGFCI